jgi:hypothetical protein
MLIIHHSLQQMQVHSQVAQVAKTVVQMAAAHQAAAVSPSFFYHQFKFYE